ncbi:MAG: sigma-54 dependent transcriptional regulator [Deltaproteobacteria bacterium]|nr:sigma-54 dependent transcriptional regulator [Deltaproteobacteria bacterium]
MAPAEHPLTVLLVEDEEMLRQLMCLSLGDRFNVQAASSAEQALQILDRGSLPDLILLDLMLPRMDGMTLLAHLRQKLPLVPVIILTGDGNVSKIVEAVRNGASDYLVKPVEPEVLLLAIERSLENREIKRELHQRRELQLISNEKYRLIGNSPAIERIRKDIAKIGPTDATVLIEGDTGTGKELIARGLHAASSRTDQAFIALNCGAIPAELAESELFGHKAGSFTGSRRDVAGKFQLADKGTLLLDEVGELSQTAQVSLLRVLEEREYYPVGGQELVTANARIIASTNRDLKTMVKEGRFREDLYFRLNVFKFYAPPLRQRPEDIQPLAEHFLDRFNDKLKKRFQGLSPQAAKVLMEHPWRGNIRELRNLLERVVISEDDTLVRQEHLYFIDPAPVPTNLVSEEIVLPVDGINLGQLERHLILQALARADGNRVQAARLLGLSPPTLYYRLKKYDLG